MGYLDLNLARKRRGLLPPNGEPLPDERSPYLAADPTPQPTIPFRPRVVDPESYTGESPDVVEAGSSAQQVRPKIADPEQFTEDRIDTLQHMPLEHVGFKRRAGMALENFGQAITQGLQNAAAYGHPLSTYDAMNLIGAGISSGAPMLAGRVASRAVRDEEVGQNRERLLNFDQARQRRAAREDATLKRAQGVATFNKTVAETDRLVHPKPDVQLVKGKGGWFAVDKNDIGSKPTKLPIDPDSPDTPPRQFEHMGVRYETVKDDTGKWVTRAVEGLPTDESAVPVPYKPTADSPTFMVRPADAVRGATEIEGANIHANAQGGANAVAAANENADREYQTKLAAWKLEGDRASDYNTLKDKRDEAERRFNAAQKILLSVDPAALKDKDRANYAERQAELESLSGELNDLNKQERAARESLNPEFVEFRPDGHARQKSQLPQPKVQAKPAPAKRTGGPVATPPISETDFLAHAKSQMGDAYDEGKARAAYRKRYGR
jgi:hypothetical protein